MTLTLNDLECAIQLKVWFPGSMPGANVHAGYVTNYFDQQPLKPDDHYILLPNQRLWTFDVLVCPLWATERFLSQPLVCGTVFHHTSLLSALSPSSAVVLNHISSHFLIPLSDSSLICTMPAQWLVILDTIIVIIHLTLFNILLTVRVFCWHSRVRREVVWRCRKVELPDEPSRRFSAGQCLVEVDRWQRLHPADSLHHDLRTLHTVNIVVCSGREGRKGWDSWTPR